MFTCVYSWLHFAVCGFRAVASPLQQTPNMVQLPDCLPDAVLERLPSFVLGRETCRKW